MKAVFGSNSVCKKKDTIISLDFVPIPTEIFMNGIYMQKTAYFLPQKGPKGSIVREQKKSLFFSPMYCEKEQRKIVLKNVWSNLGHNFFFGELPSYFPLHKEKV